MHFGEFIILIRNPDSLIIIVRSFDAEWDDWIIDESANLHKQMWLLSHPA